MHEISCEIDESGNPLSGLLASLSNQKISFRSTFGNPHPVAAQAVAFRQLAGSLATLLDALEPVIAITKASDLSAEQSNVIAEHFRQVVYRSTETFDFYAIALPDALGGNIHRSQRHRGREYRAAIKRRRDHWALICNKLKHSLNVLVPVAIDYLYFAPTVLGFGVCSYQNDTVAPNPLIHPNGKALGYASELHQLAADILKCDMEAGRLATFVEEEPTAAALPNLSRGSLPLGAVFARIANLEQVHADWG